MTTYSFEAMTVGREIHFGPKTVSKQEIIEFAEEFDPAPFHLDEKMAMNSFAGGLCASGFHTNGIVMSMLCDAYILDSTSEGAFGVEECLWPNSVRPGDILQGKSTVLSARQSKSRPHTGILRIRHETWNQKGEKVHSMTTNNIFRLSGEDRPNE